MPKSQRQSQRQRQSKRNQRKIRGGDGIDAIKNMFGSDETADETLRMGVSEEPGPAVEPGVEPGTDGSAVEPGTDGSAVEPGTNGTGTETNTNGTGTETNTNGSVGGSGNKMTERVSEKTKRVSKDSKDVKHP
jgi:hypothetical protein